MKVTTVAIDVKANELVVGREEDHLVLELSLHWATQDNRVSYVGTERNGLECVEIAHLSEVVSGGIEDYIVRG